MPILEAKNLKKEYILGDNKIYAVKDISLEIHEGDFIAIIGKSGSGKSTLAKITNACYQIYLAF